MIRYETLYFFGVKNKYGGALSRSSLYEGKKVRSIYCQHFKFNLMSSYTIEVFCKKFSLFKLKMELLWKPFIGNFIVHVERVADIIGCYWIPADIKLLLIEKTKHNCFIVNTNYHVEFRQISGMSVLLRNFC